jgi:endonuclease YncB( thermonuclease family)
MAAKIFWDPEGLRLDSLRSSKLVEVTDGDTPVVTTSIRMLSVDTPEKRYNNKKPSAYDESLAKLAGWMAAGKAPIVDALAAQLQPKLATGQAGTLQEQQGAQASATLTQLMAEKLTKPDGKKRSLFIWIADEPFDQYGRLLAYLAPSYSPQELQALTRMQRATFNLLMVDTGWAAPFPIYPSLPRFTDLELLRSVAQSAHDTPKGAWQNPASLTGYEYRMCVRLFEVTEKLEKGEKLSSAERHGWIDRYCVDMTTLEVFEPQNYFRVKPYNRVFVWPQDISEAVAQMNLVPG